MLKGAAEVAFLVLDGVMVVLIVALLPRLSRPQVSMAMLRRRWWWRQRMMGALVADDVFGEASLSAARFREGDEKTMLGGFGEPKGRMADCVYCVSWGCRRSTLSYLGACLQMFL